VNCRHCRRRLEHVFLDLGFAPPSNAYLTAEDLRKAESYLPLKLLVCTNCWLVQTEDYAAAAELFRPDYAYFSSVSQSWLDHCARYVNEVTDRFSLGTRSYVVEIASNDGYLLRNFVKRRIPCLGIEPTASTASMAEANGIPTLRSFFTAQVAAGMAAQGKRADLIIGNNVYAHVPDINDFTAGLKTLLQPNGVITLEFPHLLNLMRETQFDTVYHEHFSYLSVLTVLRMFEAAGLKVWDIQRQTTHGGSLRVFGCHADDPRAVSPTVSVIVTEERDAGLHSLTAYELFQGRANRIKNEFVQYLIQQAEAGKKVAGYGAAAKGNTLLNFAGVKPDLLPYICDAAPSKQGRFTPGSHIPIFSPAELRLRRPDIVLVLPWNIANEVIAQHSYISEWGGRFVTALPHLKVFDNESLQMTGLHHG
jgi:SAM-dependent methyltransferase